MTRLVEAEAPGPLCVVDRMFTESGCGPTVSKHTSGAAAPAPSGTPHG